MCMFAKNNPEQIEYICTQFCVTYGIDLSSLTL